MTEYHIYDLLWQITQKEKQTSEIQQLPKTFYDDINTFINSFNNKELTESDQSIKKNTTRMIMELFEKRKQKILIYSAYKKPLPQPAVPSEQEFYNKISETIKTTKLPNSDETKQKQTLKSLQAIPEIILPSGKKIGPLNKDQLLEMTDKNEDAEFLINNSLCVPV